MISFLFAILLLKILLNIGNIFFIKFILERGSINDSSLHSEKKINVRKYHGTTRLFPIWLSGYL